MQAGLVLARIALVLALVSPSVPSLALAEGEGSFDTVLEQALEAYKARDYDRAIAGFEAAYQLRPEPELVYNIARSHERALRRKEAIDAYERFTKLPGTTAELRAQALTALEALKKEQAAIDRAAQASVQKSVVDPGPSAGDRTTAVTVKPRERSHVAEWVLIGGGATVAAAGGVFGVLALEAQNDFNTSKDVNEKSSFRTDAKRDALVADVMIGAGAVSAVVGVVLWLTGGGDDAVVVAPAAGDGRAALVVSGAF